LDALHVRDLGLATAPDATILERARVDHRVVVSRDADFSALLSQGNLDWPSFVHLRTPGLNRPEEQVDVLCRVLLTAAAALAQGAIVTVRHDKFRIRVLPMA
jgi:predicted nuclease of predicted toxin-antitoxin system